jgi:hypothetical protein
MSALHPGLEVNQEADKQPGLARAVEELLK